LEGFFFTSIEYFHIKREMVEGNGEREGGWERGVQKNMAGGKQLECKYERRGGRMREKKDKDEMEI
jgi:hypothetical protein